jgi:hypothetical protein
VLTLPTGALWDPGSRLFRNRDSRSIDLKKSGDRGMVLVLYYCIIVSLVVMSTTIISGDEFGVQILVSPAPV